MQKKISFIIGLISIIINLHGQSNWGFVGPISNNTTSGVETGLINNIAIDPNNPLHLFVASMFGGLWESTDRGLSWVNINTNSTGCNGIQDIAFINSSQILIGNYHNGYQNADVSYGASIYNFSNQTWSNLGALTVSKYTIKSVAVHPSNPSIFYICTSIGLYKSTNAGISWTQTLSGCIENIVFISKPGGYYCYVAGSNTIGDSQIPTGSCMLKESSDDGTTFTDISFYISMDPSFIHSHSKVCIGPDNGLGNKTLFIMTVAIKLATPSGAQSPNWDLSAYDPNAGIYIHRIVKNVNSGTITSPTIPSNLFQDTYGSPARMGIAYDPQNNGVWFGGVYLDYLDLNDYSHHNLQGATHNDLHDIDINLFTGNFEMVVACDGGIYRTPLNVTTPVYDNLSFSTINSGLNICAINGFSGSEKSPNVYSLGSQDISHVDVFDATTYRRFTSGESDGTMIDKFDDSFMMYDNYSGDAYTRIASNYTLSSASSFNYFYWPKSTSPFLPDTLMHPVPGGTFGGDKIKQDPYRRGRVYKLGITGNPRLFQYDFNSNNWVYKTQFTNGTGGDCWNEAIADISFSPQTANSMYVVTNGGPGLIDPPARVHKYIGPNLDDSYWNHYENTDASNNPQWQNISPNYAAFSTLGGGAANITTAADLSLVAYVAVETSRWNKDLIYVAGLINFTGPNASIKVITYNGSTWSDYSTGIPANEFVTAMVMDHLSNDGIYLSTDKAVYYRSKGMPSWVTYTSGLPIIKIKQMEINFKENSVRAGTYGRGIYKSQLQCPSQSDVPLTGSIPADIYEGSVSVTASGIAAMSGGPTAFRGGHYVTLNPGFKATATSTPNTYLLAYIHGCTININNSSSSPGMYRSSSNSPALQQDGEIERGNDVQIYPNPNNGIFTITMQNEEQASVEVFDVNGRLVYKTSIDEEKTELKLSNIEAGIYLLQITTKSSVTTKHKIVIMK